jgi:hypothetical protein
MNTWSRKSKPGELERYRYVAILTIIVVVFDTYYSKKDAKTQKKMDGTWDLFHFCFYFGLAYFVPNNWPLILALHVCWELFEDFLGYGCGMPTFIETDGKKVIDMFANSAGYLLGNAVFNSRTRKAAVPRSII